MKTTTIVILVIAFIMFALIIGLAYYVHKQELKYNEAVKKCNGDEKCIEDAKKRIGLPTQKVVDNSVIAFSVLGDVSDNISASQSNYDDETSV